MQISCASRIPERPPLDEHVAEARESEYAKGGEAAQERAIRGEDARDRRLLQEHFRDEDPVGVAGAAPRKVPAMPVIPAKQPSPEAPPKGRIQALRGR